MAVIFTEPLDTQITYTQWGRLIQKTTFEAGGFMALGLTGMNDTAAPKIAAGSRVEAGGSLYKCESDETVSGTAATGVCYIYCVPAGSAATFSYSSAAPVWNAVKGGWYNGNNRAVAVFYKNSGAAYIGKKILENTPETRYPDFSMGAVGTLYKTVTESDAVLIPKGVYRVVAVGGGGSAGSSAGTIDRNKIDYIAGTGGAGSSGEMVEAYVRLDKDIRCNVECGKGGEGGYTPNADQNGVPGKAGRTTTVTTDREIITAYGGAGGAAGARWTTNANAGDGESSSVATGGVGVKGDGNRTTGNPGVKKHPWINVGDGLQIASTISGNIGGGINGKQGGRGGNFDNINGGDGAPGCGGGGPFADTYAGNHSNGGKAGNGGNGYVEFWKLA